MEEKKLTDEEIVKALECCANGGSQKDCELCPIGIIKCFEQENLMPQLALDLINRQKAEIERLKIDLANEKNWGKIQTKQAVKDTAKEILITAIQLSDMCRDFYEFQNRLVDLIEVNYGVKIVQETIIPAKSVEVE